MALALVSQGVVQTFEPYRKVTLIEPTKDADGKAVTEQTIAVGPAASQIAIKQLGTNGGGFFNANSAHPLENPTPLSNFLEVGVADRHFGRALLHLRQDGRATRGRVGPLLAAMLVLFVPFCVLALLRRAVGQPGLRRTRRRSSSRSASSRAETWKARRSAMALPSRPSGPPRPRPPRAARSTPCTIPLRRWAGWSPLWLMHAGRSGLRRRRQRALRHVGLCHHRRVHRRADGRPHARVSGQENRGLRDEDGRAGRPGHADGRADRHRGGRGHRLRAGRHLQPRPARL